jgi:hypothetical protein
MLSQEGIELECSNCGATIFVQFELPEPLPLMGSKTELSVTCDNCFKTQWMTLTIKPRLPAEPSEGSLAGDVM